jgi:uncharacterized protein (DUF58 family)
VTEAMVSALRSRVAGWLSRTGGIQAGPVTLTQRRIYILPTPAGLLFAATVLVMLFGCINYNLGLGYVLTFLVSGVGTISILHTFRNLARLQVGAGRAQPVFRGDDAVFGLMFSNPTQLARYSVCVRRDAAEPVYFDVPAGQATQVQLRVPTQARGRLPLGRLRVATTFPLGLFYAWSNVELDAQCIVYPRPESGPVPLPPPHVGDEEGMAGGQGHDDFAGLRKYQPGDSLRHVAWKAVARGQPPLTKQFSGLAAGEIWFDWDQLPGDMPVERRLARLARWVMEAARTGQPFGLRLPSRLIAPAAGATHEEHCLTALALFTA